VDSLITEAHSFLSTAFCRRLLTFISFRFFSTFSTHFQLGLPFLLLPSGLLSNIVLSALHLIHSYYMSTPFHYLLFDVCYYVYSSLNSCLVLFLHIPYCTTGPYILLNISLSYVPSLFISISVMARVSLPYTKIAFAIFLYTL